MPIAAGARHAHDHQGGDEPRSAAAGWIIRLPRLRAHISSRKETENPSCPRNRMSHSRTAPMNNSRRQAGEKVGILRDVELQKAPDEQLHRRPIDELEHARPRRAQEVEIAQHHRGHPMVSEGDRRALRARFIARPRAPRRARAPHRERPSSRRLCLAVAGQQALRRVVVLDAAVLHHDDALAQPLHLGHVRRGGAARSSHAARESAPGASGPSRRCLDQGSGRLVEQEARQAG